MLTFNLLKMISISVSLLQLGLCGEIDHLTLCLSLSYLTRSHPQATPIFFLMLRMTRLHTHTHTHKITHTHTLTHTHRHTLHTLLSQTNICNVCLHSYCLNVSSYQYLNCQLLVYQRYPYYIAATRLTHQPTTNTNQLPRRTTEIFIAKVALITPPQLSASLSLSLSGLPLPQTRHPLPRSSSVHLQPNKFNIVTWQLRI